MDFEPNCRDALSGCIANCSNASPYEETSDDPQHFGCSNFKTGYLKSNCMQDFNVEEDELQLFSTKQKSARRIPRKFSRARPLTEEELDRKRVTANVQERRRMQRLNTALEKLKRAIPQHLHMQYRRLSKIKTLRLAIDYIGFLEENLTPKFGKQFCANSSQVQIYEAKDVNTFNSEVCDASDAMLEDEGFLENEDLNQTLVVSNFESSVNCAEVQQHNQCNPYFGDVALPQDNLGFNYLEHF